MGRSSFPELHAQSPKAQAEDCGHTFQANYKCPCYIYYAQLSFSRLIALMLIRGFFIQCMPESFDYG